MKVTEASLMTVQQQRDFYEDLRKRLHDWSRRKASAFGQNLVDVVLLAPDLFYLLCRLVRDPSVPRRQKVRLLAGIAYFVWPFDLLPECILGPVGYLDDVAVALFILDDLFSNVDPAILDGHWPGEESVLQTVRHTTAKLNGMLGRRLLRRLRRWIETETPAR